MIYDIIVVGGGIAGLHFASLMKAQGRKVLVLEGKPQIERKICGEYLCPKGVQLLESKGRGDLLKGFEPIFGMKLVSGKGRQIESYFPDTKQKNFGVSVNRKTLEERLFDYYKNIGGEIHLGKQVTQIDTSMDIVNITAGGAVYKSRFVVGADGRMSRVAKFFGVDVVQKRTRVAIHSYIKPKMTLPRLGQMHLFDDGAYIGVDPITEQETNISLVCDAELLKAKKDPREVLNEYIQNSNDLSAQFSLLSQEMPIWTVCPIHSDVTQVASTKYALIGDAGGFVDPLTGEGMYNALVTAEILAESIEKYGRAFDFARAADNYTKQKKKIMDEKKKLNIFFQWFIRKPLLVECLAIVLSWSQRRANSFIGIIGNVYRPFEGFTKMIL